MSLPVLGIVIPTLDEARHLPDLLRDLRRIDVSKRVVVSDGGSTDATRDVARDAGAACVSGPRGRARQLNAGAAALDTRWLLFLHADSRLPPAAADALVLHLAGDPSSAAYFRFALEGRGWFWRFIELGQRIRERTSGLVYGDQGLLVRRSAFEALGGYPDLPVMEDVEIVRRLRGAVGIEAIPARLPTSPREYERYGRWRGWLRNTAAISLYLAGVPPDRLAEWYARPRGDASRGTNGGYAMHRDDALMVFAKAPEPGTVKTRLAAEIGDARAVSIYRSLGRRVVDQVRGGGYRTVVYYDPPDALDTVRGWLGEHGVEYRPQGGGGLGERLEQAFEETFRTSRRVCVIGTDAPGVDRACVERAFASLEGSDVVFGPAADGGYYLIGLDRPQPELFRDVPWSTDQVFARSLGRASALGLRPAILPSLSDIDTLDDLNRVGL